MIRDAMRAEDVAFVFGIFVRGIIFIGALAVVVAAVRYLVKYLLAAPG